ncbi:MAG TPA: histidine kinase, partial [Spirochaetia bacterium]|nr:histidine kinase [Spirochaetia bacterium]
MLTGQHLARFREVLSIRNRWRSLRLRDKLLSFYTAMITVILLINVGTSYAAFNYMQVFNQNLRSYFNIHQLQTAIESNRVALERYLRERGPDYLVQYENLAPKVHALLQTVESESSTGLESYFQLRATRRGLDAYFRLADLAIEKRKLGADDYYSTYVQATRIQTYVDGYVSLLLSIRLSDGSRSYQMLLHRAMTVRSLSLLALVFLGILSIVFGVLFSNYVSRPIRRLANLSSRIAAGDLDIGNIEVNSRDEIGILAESFNAMSQSIRERVNDLREKAVLEKRLHEEELTVVRMEQSLREAQFLGLQSQINPHFLFNTLNIIARSALFERADGTATLIQSLSRLFRYNLRNSQKTVTLKEELDIIEEYLSIQKRRYEDRLQVRIRCMVDAEQVAVPCFTLQPLVENALKYGIEPREEGGLVEVVIRRRAGSIHISIHDDGPGMSAEQIRRLFDGSETSSDG